jgi:hypothetical protein
MRGHFSDTRGERLDAAHEAYRELVSSGGEAFEQYRRDGKAATLAHRVGGQSFGKHVG